MTLSDVESGPLRLSAPVEEQTVVIPGDPVVWRPMHVTRTGNRFMDKKQAARGDEIAAVIQRELERGTLTAFEPKEPVALYVTFFIARPKNQFGTGKNSAVLKAGSPRYPVVRGDLTNYLKGIEDGLVRGRLLPDDDAVVRSTAAKVYAAYGSEPHSVVRVRPA